MCERVLAEWDYAATSDSASVILPDGCQDLLFWAPKNTKPYWIITSLDESTYHTNIRAGDFLKGYRLKPGTVIARKNLLSAVQMLDVHGDIADKIGCYSCLSSNVEDALKCLGEGPSVCAAASSLGVNMRSLQRLLKPTGRTPSGWVSLARARKAARAVGSLSDAAHAYGFTDQPHMNREFRRWFNCSPAQMKKQPDVLSQLDGAGYF